MSFYTGGKAFSQKIKDFVSGKIDLAKVEILKKADEKDENAKAAVLQSVDADYMKKSNTYTKASLYTKTEVDKLISDLKAELTK